MQKEEIYTILKEALMELFELEESKISMEALIYDDLDIDSIDAIDLVDYIKRKTGQRMEPADFKAVRSIGDIVDAVYNKIASSK